MKDKLQEEAGDRVYHVQKVPKIIVKEQVRNTGIYKKLSTGRATCKICGKLIKEGIDVVFSAYKIERHYHEKCIRDLILEEN